ncbi:hypothetical protein ACMGE9_03575 [Macrococcus sp. EM39E]|uniref:hypothetical protein n=1 Tax=Macrococcus animalis TaxID=3395467 RepID=UPI0039BDAF86
MKRLLVLIFSMLYILAACGGLESKVDGKTFIAEVGPKEDLKKLGYISFKEDEVTFSSDETKIERRGTVKYDEDEKIMIKLADNPVYKNGEMKLSNIVKSKEGLNAELEIYSNEKKVEVMKGKLFIQLTEKEEGK